VLNWNQRTENHGEEQELASDLSLVVSVPCQVLSDISESIPWENMLWNGEGMVLDLKFSKIRFDMRYENYKLILYAEGSETSFTEVRLRKFVAIPKDGRRVELKFQAQLHPKPKQIEALGKALTSERVSVKIEAPKGAVEINERADERQLPLEETSQEEEQAEE
jgi:hypothetical protein